MRVESGGWITEGRSDVGASDAAFWSALGLDPDAAARTLAAARVRVK